MGIAPVGSGVSMFDVGGTVDAFAFFAMYLSSFANAANCLSSYC